MWLFTRYGFFSVSSFDKRRVAIRARARKHLEQLRHRLPFLKKYDILEDSLTDYRWRIIIPRNIWVDAVLTITVEQRWPNFKAEAHRFCPDVRYDDCLSHIWGVMKEQGEQWDWDAEEEAAKGKQNAARLIHK